MGPMDPALVQSIRLEPPDLNLPTLEMQLQTTPSDESDQ